MASNQPNRSSRWKGPRAANARPVSTTPSQTSRLGQWRQNYERYKSLAESTDNSDAVTREGYWQHAEYFIRLINEAQRGERLLADNMSVEPGGDGHVR